MLERLKRWLGQVTQPRPAVETVAVDTSAPATPVAADCILVIDVRTEREFRASAVEGAVNVPLSQLEHRIREVAADPATPLVLYCASGARSGVACMMLRQLGYSNVDNAGGLYAAAARLRLALR